MLAPDLARAAHEPCSMPEGILTPRATGGTPSAAASATGMCAPGYGLAALPAMAARWCRAVPASCPPRRRPHPISALRRSGGGDHGRPVGDDRGEGGRSRPDGRKRVTGRERRVLLDRQGVLVACRVESAGMPDRRAARALTGGSSPLRPEIHAVTEDAGSESKALAEDIEERNGRRPKVAGRRAPGAGKRRSGSPGSAMRPA